MKMINKNYFRYLIRQNKRYLLLIWIISFIIIPLFTLLVLNDNFNNMDTIAPIAMLLGLSLSFLAPIYLFSFLNKKKSNILYYSLPIKKESLFTTTFLFSLFATIIPIVVNYVIALLINLYIYINQGYYILSILFLIIYMICMQAITTTIVLLCQNTLDSFIASAMYQIIPFIFYFCFNSYLSSITSTIMLGEGNYNDYFNIVIHVTSVIYNSIFTIRYSAQGNSLVNYNIVIYWFIVAIIFIIISYRLFKKRNLEQSENYSKSIFIYPVLITVIIFSLTMTVCHQSFNQNTILMYTLIFVLYLILYFFAIRKVYFTWKIPVIFIVLIISCIGFANVFESTNGFNTLSEYPDFNTQTEFSMDININNSIDYHGQNINYIYISSSDQRTMSLVRNFHHELVDQKIITPQQYNEKMSDNVLWLNLSYNDTNLDTAYRNYRIVSNKNIKQFITLYDNFIQSIQNNNYSFNHDERFDSYE